MLKSASVAVMALVIALTLGCGYDSKSPVAPETDTGPPAAGELNAFEQNSRLGRGINLGNALEAPHEGEWGVILHDWFYDKIVEAGFTSVRIPMRWSAHVSTAAPYAVDQTFLRRASWAVDQALLRGLAVVINIHHYESMMRNPALERQRFLAMWQQIGEHFKNYPGELFFEVLNEPNSSLTPALWNQYLRDAIAVIRQSNPGRTLIVGAGEWGSLGGLVQLELPRDDRNLIASFHYYEPFQFTHQGAGWVPGSSAWLGRTWTGTQSQQQSVVDDLATAAHWASRNNRPIYLGEFGAIHKADLQSRARWTTFVVKTAESLRFSWSYWEFISNFAAFDRTSNQWNQALLSSLIQ